MATDWFKEKCCINSKVQILERYILAVFNVIIPKHALDCTPVIILVIQHTGYLTETNLMKHQFGGQLIQACAIFTAKTER